LEELDGFSEQHGWLEFRFGTDIFQKGYYDSPGVSEFRLTPCPPTEAIRRYGIIGERIEALANEHNVAIMTGPNLGEHVHLSVYAPDSQGNMQPLIGHGEERQSNTIAMLSGIGAGFQDGLFLHPSYIQGTDTFMGIRGRIMEMGPQRREIRVVEDRLESRSHQNTEQALNILMGGIIYGLEKGESAISEDGYDTPFLKPALRVHRTPEFDKKTDLDLQRGVENAEQVGEGLEVDLAWKRTFAEDFVVSLLPARQIEELTNYPVFVDIIFQSMRIASDGTPYIDQEALAQIYGVDPASIAAVTRIMNNRLGVLRVEQTDAIKGQFIYEPRDEKEAMEHLRHSDIASLTFDGKQDKFIEWLRTKT
jgi:hypothetical protein